MNKGSIPSRRSAPSIISRIVTYYQDDKVLGLSWTRLLNIFYMTRKIMKLLMWPICALKCVFLLFHSMHTLQMRAWPARFSKRVNDFDEEEPRVNLEWYLCWIQPSIPLYLLFYLRRANYRISFCQRPKDHLLVMVSFTRKSHNWIFNQEFAIFHKESQD